MYSFPIYKQEEQSLQPSYGDIVCYDEKFHIFLYFDDLLRPHIISPEISGQPRLTQLRWVSEYCEDRLTQRQIQLYKEHKEEV